MALQEENDDLRQELENDAEFPIYPRSGKRRGQLDHSQTQELEDLMVENQQLQERLKVLDDENVGLGHIVVRQKEEILALQELNDKTGTKFAEEDKDTKTRLHVWKDKVNLLQQQMRDDKALSDMLSREQKLRSTLERRLEDANEKLKEAREEIVRLHEDLSQSEQQKQKHEKAYADACNQMEELRIMSEADRQAAERQAQELNDQIMMMTPGSSMDGAFGFDSPSLHKNSVSLGAGQDLLSQMQMIDDEVEEEVEMEDAQADEVLEAEKLQSELQSMRSALQIASAEAEQARAVWESEKGSLTAELAAQRATAEALEKTLTEERSALQIASAEAEQARAVWESEKGSLTAELAAQRATAEALEKTLTEERLSTNQTPQSTCNSESAGFKLVGASPAKAVAADRVSELESQVVELEGELAKARRLLQRWQEEREQSWSSIVNSFMCATNR